MTIAATIDEDRAHDARLETLLDRLSEPRTVAALDSLLDHVELLAVLVSGIDGLARKGDTISDTIAEVITELRAAQQATGLDPRQTTHQLAVLIPTFADAAPAIGRVASSPIVDEGPIAVVGLTGTALSEAYAKASGSDLKLGLRGLLKAFKDDDIQHGLAFLVEVARVLGRELKAPSAPVTPSPTPGSPSPQP